MATQARTHRPRINPVMREEERVTPLELFFDLVFVLALTQCTTLMAHDPTWDGLARGILMLGLLWWAWTGFAWLTSVVNPEEGSVRIAMFAAMGALLIVALAVPSAFGDEGMVFAIGYGIVRFGQIALFALASRDEPQLRRSVIGLAWGTGVGVGLVVVGALFEGDARLAIWALALALDVAEPYFFGSEGWQLVPGHFAERHGLILIIALGEAIVAIGVGAEGGVTVGIATAAILGIGVAAAQWWLYFDIVALVSARRLERAAKGRERNEMARDSYSLLHFPMVAGIVLVALGMKKTIGDVSEPLDTVPAFALVGGLGIYLLALVGFRYRHVYSINRHRLVLGVALIASLPLIVEIPALAALALVNVPLWSMIIWETISYGDARAQTRRDGLLPELARRESG
jgi:low temperature requirement protein LtrA